jgi:hypothetical protein
MKGLDRPHCDHACNACNVRWRHSSIQSQSTFLSKAKETMMMLQDMIAAALLLNTIQAQTPEWRIDLGIANANQLLYVADNYIFAFYSQSMHRLLDSVTGSIHRKVYIKSTDSNLTTMIASYRKRSTTP